MSNQLGPLDIDCDAPSYAVVRACSEIGIQSPEDVRWCRMSRHLERVGGGSVLAGLVWPGSLTCSCGEVLPRLGRYVLTLSTGEERTHYFGQCGRCRTVYWD